MKNVRENFGIKGRVRWIKTRAGTGEVIEESPWNDNKIMLGTNTGLDLVLDRLDGDATYSLKITHADLGSEDGAPQLSDISLLNAVARAPKSSADGGNVAGGTLTIRFFFPDGGLPNGTYWEFGAFVDGSASVDTGRLFERVVFGAAYNKAAGEDSTFELQITGTPA